MPGKLEVSFNSPQCGWMSVGFEDGANEFHTTTSNAPHEQALPQLMTILTELLGNERLHDEYILQWNRNPEAFDFLFRRDGDSVTLEIYQYPGDERNLAERELMFTHKGPINDLCAAFGVTFDQLYSDRNTDEFEFNWRQPFPHPEYEQFKNKLI